MKRLLATLLMIAAPAFAGIPVTTNTATIDITKTKGGFSSFSWSWIGYNNQAMAFNLTMGTNPVSIAGSSVGFRLSAYTTQELVYVDMNTAQDNMSNLGTSVLAWLSYSNIPPNRQYQAELFAWDGITTNNTRTLAQGRVTVFQSLYGANDQFFKFPVADSNYQWFTQTALSAEQNRAILAEGVIAANLVSETNRAQVAEAMSSNALTIAIQTETNRARQAESVMSNAMNTAIVVETNRARQAESVMSNALHVAIVFETNRAFKCELAVSNLVNTTSNDLVAFILSSPVTNDHAQLQLHIAATGTNVHGLGTASTNKTTDFATAAQGALLGSAVQKDGSVAMTGALDLNNHAINGMSSMNQTNGTRLYITAGYGGQPAEIIVCPDGSYLFVSTNGSSPIAMAPGSVDPSVEGSAVAHSIVLNGCQIIGGGVISGSSVVSGGLTLTPTNSWATNKTVLHSANGNDLYWGQ